jgi:hypothetical protein
MNQPATNTRKFRFMVDKTTNVVVCTANYTISDSALGTRYEFRTLEVPKNVSFDPGDVVGFIVSEDGTLVDPAENFVGYSWDDLREIRDRELSASDWTQVPDAPLSAERAAEFSLWRQQLRDLPQTAATIEEARQLLKTLIDSKP